MKKLVIAGFTLVLLGTVIPASGQDLDAGLVGGINFSDLKLIGDGVEQQIDRARFMAVGAVFELGLPKGFSLRLEPKYIEKGGVYVQELNNEMDIKVSGIDIPLFLKWSYGSKVQPYVMAGPSLNIRLKAEVEAEAAGMPMKADWSDLTKRVEFGLGVGAGVSVPVGPGRLFLDGRYSWGLTNMNKGGTAEFEVAGMTVTEEIDEEDSVKTRGFQVMLGYTLPIQRK